MAVAFYDLVFLFFAYRLQFILSLECDLSHCIRTVLLCVGRRKPAAKTSPDTTSKPHGAKFSAIPDETAKQTLHIDQGDLFTAKQPILWTSAFGDGGLIPGKRLMCVQLNSLVPGGELTLSHIN